MAGIKEGALTPLLKWTVAGKEFVLKGQTFASKETGSQWFNKIEVTEGGSAAFSAVMVEGGMQISKGSRQRTLEDGQNVEVEEGGVTLKLHSSKAGKFGKEQAKAAK